MLSANEAKQAMLNARKEAKGRIPQAVAHIERKIRDAMAQGLPSTPLEFGGIGFAIIPEILNGVKTELIRNGYRIIDVNKEVWPVVAWAPDEVKENG